MGSSPVHGGQRACGASAAAAQLAARSGISVGGLRGGAVCLRRRSWATPLQRLLSYVPGQAAAAQLPITAR
eukprot:4663700-Alexandrium_andersonii.AAC.1